MFRIDEELTVDENNRLADDNYYVKGCGKNLQMVEIDKAKSQETELKLINFYGQEKSLYLSDFKCFGRLKLPYPKLLLPPPPLQRGP